VGGHHFLLRGAMVRPHTLIELLTNS
jgi:hypothetical protein